MLTTFCEFSMMCLCTRARCDPRTAYDQLIARYSEPHRAYHDLRHIDFCLKELFKIWNRQSIIRDTVRNLCEHPSLVEAAIWYHDSVYDTHAKDNEERSADLALSSLKLRKKNAAILRELILDTKHVLPPKTIDGRVLVDIDLASLAALPENFALDGRNIRKEYSWVETDKFRDGRAIFLERLLERPTIYHTLMFRNAYEGRARQNLQQAVLELRLNSTGS